MNITEELDQILACNDVLVTDLAEIPASAWDSSAPFAGSHVMGYEGPPWPSDTGRPMVTTVVYGHLDDEYYVCLRQGQDWRILHLDKAGQAICLEGCEMDCQAIKQLSAQETEALVREASLYAFHEKSQLMDLHRRTGFFAYIVRLVDKEVRHIAPR